MTDKENKQQVVDGKEVVELIARGVYIGINNKKPESGLWQGMIGSYSNIAQAALKALTDNGYIIIRG